jgi:flagellar biosynthesis protein FlhG
MHNLDGDLFNCKKICVTGGKGGVGKTSIALKMALELSRQKNKVLLIDCDENLSNTSIKLGLSIDNKFEKLLSSEISFDECIVSRGNFHLLPACNGSLTVFENKINFEDVIKDIIESHESDYNYIILDTPAGLGKSNLSLGAICDFRVIVVVPDRSSITDSYSLIKLLKSKYGISENHLLINMYQNEKQLAKVSQTLSETVKSFLDVNLINLGGIFKIDINTDEFDTFFLSHTNNETNKNFAKLLYRFTENKSGPGENLVSSRPRYMAPEQNVR